MYYGQECMEDYEYLYQPHEIEARDQEEKLYREYLFEKNGWTVPQVAQFFGNRLCSAL